MTRLPNAVVDANFHDLTDVLNHRWQRNLLIMNMRSV
jgi:hypothetical protein